MNALEKGYGDAQILSQGYLCVQPSNVVFFKWVVTNTRQRGLKGVRELSPGRGRRLELAQRNGKQDGDALIRSAVFLLKLGCGSFMRRESNTSASEGIRRPAQLHAVREGSAEGTDVAERISVSRP